ncbi:MAG: ParB/RepB/Spo0J family partition protein [candidate division Zixibacteria bacterium]|nr:ParB/RepB/Spo0J family partition protein [candidate division Zixibacteria bacterium]
MKRVALGRGLDALIPADPKDDNSKEIRDILISRIKTNPNQPRKRFDEDKLKGLAKSINQKGLIQPIIVRVAGDDYELVVGERRMRAAQLLGLDIIPSIVYNKMSKKETMELALIENIQREDLNPIEEAEAYRALLQEFGLSQEDLASQVSKDRSSISNSLRLLTLPDKVRRMVVEKMLSAGAARVILAVPGEKEKIELADKAIKEGYSVRELEKIVYGESKRRSTRRKAVKSPHLLSIEDGLRKALQTKVAIAPRKKGGRIIIDYYNNEGLTRVLERLNYSED